MIILFQIGACIVSGVLNALGGYHWLFCRRFIMPFWMGISFSIKDRRWWILFTTWLTAVSLSFGYFDHLGIVGRGLWLAMQAVAIGLGSVIARDLKWWVYLIYVIVVFCFGCLYVSWYQPVGDYLAGMLLTSIIFFEEPVNDSKIPNSIAHGRL